MIIDYFSHYFPRSCGRVRLVPRLATSQLRERRALKKSSSWVCQLTLSAPDNTPCEYMCISKRGLNGKYNACFFILSGLYIMTIQILIATFALKVLW